MSKLSSDTRETWRTSLPLLLMSRRSFWLHNEETELRALNSVNIPHRVGQSPRANINSRRTTHDPASWESQIPSVSLNTSSPLLQRPKPLSLRTRPAVMRGEPLAGAASLQALEEYVRNEVMRLPRDSPQRLVASRHVLNSMIVALPAHGPLLGEVKREYEFAIEKARAAAVAATAAASNAGANARAGIISSDAAVKGARRSVT